MTLFTKNKYLIQTIRFDLLVDWAFYCIFVDSDPYIPHGEHAIEEQVAEITIDTILKLAAQIDLDLVNSKIKIKKERKKR